MVGTDIQLLSQTRTNEEFYRDILNIAMGDDGIIDGSKLQKLDFPSVQKEYDVFISYSHNDEDLALYLASWLSNYCGLSCFLDSTVWHGADDLLKVIDDKYCLEPNKKTIIIKSAIIQLRIFTQCFQWLCMTL